jgi:hypothetical protein
MRRLEKFISWGTIPFLGGSYPLLSLVSKRAKVIISAKNKSQEKFGNNLKQNDISQWKCLGKLRIIFGWLRWYFSNFYCKILNSINGNRNMLRLLSAVEAKKSYLLFLTQRT